MKTLTKSELHESSGSAKDFTSKELKAFTIKFNIELQGNKNLTDDTFNHNCT